VSDDKKKLDLMASRETIKKAQFELKENIKKAKSKSSFGALYFELKDSVFDLEINKEFYKFKNKNTQDYILFHFAEDDDGEVYLDYKLDYIEINGEKTTVQNGQIMFLWNRDTTYPEINNLGDRELILGLIGINDQFDCVIDFANKKIVLQNFRK
jgi:hypothetical protein